MFLITNHFIKNSHKYGDIYIAGNKYNKVDYEKGFYVYEGNIDESVFKDRDFYSNKIIPRIFNVIRWDTEKKEITIKNDQLGVMPLSLLENGNIFALTNCFWMLPEYIGTSHLKLSGNGLKEFLYLSSFINENRTFFDNVKTISEGTITTITLNKASYYLDEKRYWHYSKLIRNRENNSFEDSLEMVDEALKKQIGGMESVTNGEPIGFGNSGGLDSRIVALMLSKKADNAFGVTLVNNPDNKKTGTYKAAKKVAKLAGVENYYTTMQCADYSSRMALDIRSAPFLRSQIFKNNTSGRPRFKNWVAGMHGSIVNNLGKKYDADSDLKSAINHMLLKSYRKFDKTLIVGDFGIDFDAFIERLKNELGGVEYNNQIYNYWRLTYSARFCYCGGFESLSRTKKSHFLYYPGVLNVIGKIKPEYLNNRFLIKELLRKKYPKYYKVRYQNFDKVENTEKRSKIYRYLNKRFTEKNKRKYGNGMKMNYKEEDQFKNYVHHILSQDCELFRQYLGDRIEENVLNNYDNIHNPLLLNILKLKQMLISLENENYDQYLDQTIEFY